MQSHIALRCYAKNEIAPWIVSDAVDITVRPETAERTHVRVNLFGEYELRMDDNWDSPKVLSGTAYSTGEFEKAILDFSEQNSRVAPTRLPGAPAGSSGAKDNVALRTASSCSGVRLPGVSVEDPRLCRGGPRLDG